MSERDPELLRRAQALAGWTDTDERIDRIYHELSEYEARLWFARSAAAQAEKEKTLRDEIAMAALTGLLASGPHDCGPSGYANDAYLFADAMLAAREKGGEG